MKLKNFFVETPPTLKNKTRKGSTLHNLVSIYRKSISIILALLFFSSCTVNKHIMFKDSKNFEFEIPQFAFSKDYVISPNDKISFRIRPQSGSDMITSSENGINRQALNQGMIFLVESDGKVNLPLLGRVKIAGQTIKEAELYLEEIFSEYFNKPFILLEVVNNRVIVSPGGGGSAKVVRLQDDNTTVLEALAMAGGISTTGNAKKIKLIRQTDQGREVYKIDLSTIQGLEMADMIVQAKDIIYVQPVRSVIKDFVSELGPYLSLLSSSLLIYSIATNGLGR